MTSTLNEDSARPETAEAVFKSRGAEAGVESQAEGHIPQINNIRLTQRMVPTLERVACADKVLAAPRVTGSEDFSFYARQVPGLFFFGGITAPDTPPFKAAPNHSPIADAGHASNRGSTSSHVAK